MRKIRGRVSIMFYRICCFALLAFAFVRGAFLLAHEPMIGLANNYDMIRVQGCIDAYPDRPNDIPPWANSWQGPIKHYRFRDDVHPGCFVTSEALFALALLPVLHQIALHNPGGTFPLTVIGWLKFICLMSACCAVSIALLRRGKNRSALANSLLAAILLFDPGITIYFNTFYAEFSSVFFAYLAVASAFIVLQEEQPSYLWLTICSAATALMCVSKLQHIAFGIFALLVLFVSSRIRKTSVSRGVVGAIVVGAILGGAGQWAHMHAEQTATISHANLTNTFLQAILGSSPSPATTTARLGLPARCAEFAGKNWFTPGFEDKHPCPEVFDMSRTRVLALAVTEPGTIVRTLHRGIELTRPWISDFLGKVEGGVSAPVPDDFSSWNGWLNRLPLGVFTWIFATPPLLALAIVWLRRRRKSESAMAFVLLFCACYPWYSLITVVFGDGFADTAKQFHVGTISLLAFWLLLAMLLVVALRETSFRHTSRGHSSRADAPT